MAVIEILRQEHRNILQLLEVLESQIEIFDHASEPDYDVIRGIADYFLEYPGTSHHPKENVIFRHLREHFPQEATAIGDLESEHREMGERARQFRDAVYALLSDSDIARDAVVDATRVFIETERQHMKMEEDIFFPLAEARLTPEDWSQIAQRLEEVCDPLFGDKIEEEFSDFRERLLAWQKEFRSG